MPLYVFTLFSFELFLSLDPNYHSAVCKREVRSYITELLALDRSLERMKRYENA